MSDFRVDITLYWVLRAEKPALTDPEAPRLHDKVARPYRSWQGRAAYVTPAYAHDNIHLTVYIIYYRTMMDNSELKIIGTSSRSFKQET